MKSRELERLMARGEYVWHKPTKQLVEVLDVKPYQTIIRFTRPDRMDACSPRELQLHKSK